MAPSHQINKVYLFQEYVNFGYGISSKIPEVLGKVEMKILTHSPFYKTEDFPLLNAISVNEIVNIYIFL